MKYLLFIILTLLIIRLNNPMLPQCSIDTARLSVGHRVWAEQSADTSTQNTLITRFLHNKVGIFFSEIAKCYLNTYEPTFIYKSTGLLGIYFWFYFIYSSLIFKKRTILILIILLPLFPLYNIANTLVPIFHKIIAITGAAWFLSKKL